MAKEEKVYNCYRCGQDMKVERGEIKKKGKKAKTFELYCQMCNRYFYYEDGVRVLSHEPPEHMPHYEDEIVNAHAFLKSVGAEEV